MRTNRGVLIKISGLDDRGILVVAKTSRRVIRIIIIIGCVIVIGISVVWSIRRVRIIIIVWIIRISRVIRNIGRGTIIVGWIRLKSEIWWW
jgi:hypothetical protein